MKPKGVQFDKVLAEELLAIQSRRERAVWARPNDPASSSEGHQNDTDKPKLEVERKGDGTPTPVESAAVMPDPAQSESSEKNETTGCCANHSETKATEPEIDDLKTQRAAALGKGLVGLAFSGGGIRSGSVCIGFLQGLAKLRLLRLFDYLSTVSGGGYAGAWFTAWVAREESGIRNVEKQLDPNRVEQAKADRFVQGEKPETLTHDHPFKGVIDPEPEPIYHIRSHSDYLTPRKGVFSTDSWTLLTIYLRNTLVNLLILLPALAVLILTSRLIILAYARGAGPDWVRAIVTVGLTILPPLVALLIMLYNRAKVAADADAAVADDPVDPGVARHPGLRYRLILVAIGMIILSSAAAVWTFGSDPFLHAETEAIWSLDGDWLGGLPDNTPERISAKSQLALSLKEEVNLRKKEFESNCTPDAWKDGPPGPMWKPLCPPELEKLRPLRYWGFGTVNPYVEKIGGEHIFLPLVFVVCTITIGGFGIAFNAGSGGKRRLWHTLGASIILGSALGGLCALVVYHGLWKWVFHLGLLTTFGPPLFMVAFVLAGFLEQAVFGKYLHEYEREWRSRFAASVLMAAGAWVAFFGVTLYLPGLLTMASGQLSVPILIGWVGTVLGGVFAARTHSTTGTVTPSRIPGILAAIVPVIFLVGVLALLSLLISALLGSEADVPVMGKVDVGLRPMHAGTLAIAIAGCIVWVAFLSRVADVNLFSLHSLYGNRLIRCFLAASRPKRHESTHEGVPRRSAPIGVKGSFRSQNLFTGFDPRDDMPLSAMGPVEIPGPPVENAGRPLFRFDYDGPLPILNTALNLVGGDDLAIRDRKAASFVLTPWHCGCELTGYRWTPTSDSEKWNLTLGRAMTISGAAADANMAFVTSSAQVALLTLLNARLGWWLQNPREWKAWSADTPKWGLCSLLFNEFRGQTNEKQKYVHLSDGGHFDNSGAYELIRRRCRFVVMVDAAEDVSDASENLANLMRLVRRDFGIRIDINTAPLRKDEHGLSRWHVAVGAIRYEDVDNNGLAGTLVFIRSSMTGDESVDLREYANRDHRFPHHPTLPDQWFDEVQFESYRQLGSHLAESVFAETAADFDIDQLTEENHGQRVRRFFAGVRNQWFPPPPELQRNAVETDRMVAQLMSSLRTDPNLANLIRDLYPELPEFSEKHPDHAELVAVIQILNVMQNAWMSLGLGEFHSHPAVSGWMVVFRRCSTAGTFQRFWPVLRGTFSRDFVRFCEKTLNLTPVIVRPSPLTTTVPGWEDHLRSLDIEFQSEWGWHLEQIENKQERAKQAKGVKKPESDCTDIPPLKSLQDIFRKDPKAVVWLLNIELDTGRLETSSGQQSENETATSESSDSLEQSPSTTGEGTVSKTYPVGIIAVYRPCLEVVSCLEVVFWIRGAYRSQGLGRNAMGTRVEWPENTKNDEVLNKILRKQVFDRFGAMRVLARFPDVGTTTADSLQKALWLNFFHDWDFNRVQTERGAPFIVVSYEVTA